jgi:hypothetical protein
MNSRRLIRSPRRPWRVTARCPIVDPDLAPGQSAIPVLVAAMVLTARRLLRFLVLGRSNGGLRLRRARKYNARLYGRGLSKIAHSEGAQWHPSGAPASPSALWTGTAPASVPDGTKRLGGEQFYTDASCPIPLGPPGQRRGQGAAMISILHDLLVFSCLAAFVTGIVLAAASLLI